MAKIKNLLTTIKETIIRVMRDELVKMGADPSEISNAIAHFEQAWHTVVCDPRATVSQLQKQLECGFPPAGVTLIGDNPRELIAFKKAIKWAMEANKENLTP